MEDKERYCVECKADWQGKAIPLDSLKHYGNKTHFSRLIGIYSWEQDRTMHYECPDCRARYDREYNLIP